MDLVSLGLELRLVDQKIADLILQRIELARRVGLCKYLNGDDISRPSIEDGRIAQIKQYASEIGLNPNFASSFLYQLIDECCKEQMIQLQQGNLLRENIMKLSEYGNETCISARGKQYVAVNLVPRSLSAKDRDFLFEMIYPVAQSAFGQPHSEKFAHDVKVHALDHAEILVVLNDDRAPVAFRVWDVMDSYQRPIIYLAGMCVSLTYQKCGLGPVMIQKALDLASISHPDWGYVVLRTQNWAMQKSFARIAQKSGLYQKYGDVGIAPDVQEVAQLVATKNRDIYFDASKLISRKIYGASLYGAKKNYSDGFPGLNVDEGDAAYCVWRR